MVRRVFVDGDELATLPTSANAKIFVREPSLRSSSVISVKVGDLQLYSVHLVPAMTAVYTVNPDIVQIAFPLGRGAECKLRGRSLGIANIVYFSPGKTYVTNSTGAIRCLCVCVPLHAFRYRKAMLHANRPLIELPDGIYTPPVHLLEAARHIIAVLYRFGCRFPTLAVKPGANKVVLGPVLDMLIRLTETEANGDLPDRSLWNILNQVEQFISAHEEGPLYISDLCVVAQTSERTIRNVFRKVYGTSPMRYLRLRRLNYAYRALRQSDPDVVNVTDIAMRFGFLDVGRFAFQYRQMFGEYPSQTLRKP